MKKLKIKNCNECPFLYSDYDDYSMGDSTLDICVLSQFNNIDNRYIISSHNECGSEYHKEIPECGSEYHKEIPEWCPLKGHPLQIELLSSSTTTDTPT